MKAPAWKVAQHGPLTAVASGLWTVGATLDLLPIGRQMVVARTAPGELLVYSAVACDETTMGAIEALGRVRTLVVPSASHRIDAPRYAARYPDARLLTPRAARRHVEKVVAVHDTLDAAAEAGLGSQLRVEMLDGVPFEGVLLHSDEAGDVTLIFNDALMNLPERLPGFKGWLTRAMGSTGGPKVTPTARRFIVRDPQRYRQHLERLARLPRLKRVLVSHGSPIEHDVAEVLLRVARTL
jgi:hypothetical protein